MIRDRASIMLYHCTKSGNFRLQDTQQMGLTIAWISRQHHTASGADMLGNCIIQSRAHMQAARQQGIGAALVAAVCGDLRKLGYTQAEVPWVGPIAFFANRGATLSRAFRRFSRTLDPPNRGT